ncbi:phosphate ABC transporter substrate-binding protein [Spiroplasma alleghenense]|uniref:Phosphate ABC transporter substrate-binding protein n=1 Tax=Spiroplasma alleghenense TaxID=216931 RepID=A0A345Z410_9MOLU|nr:phosphate ABC transporter substrate-binding protein [Spiroplasma alleghenense]AXK51339.1 phosphate ABC transporter substrate-binding protein [Spiroplasma alleghenense]
MTKKIAIWLSTIFVLLAALWIWTLVIPKNSHILGGSTSVNPLMQKLTNSYYKDTKKDFVYNSTGSQAGVVGVQNGSYEIGFISKDVTQSTLTTGEWTEAPAIFDEINESGQSSVAQALSKTDELDKTLSLEFAVDAIAIIYNPPAGWDEILSQNLNFIFAKKDQSNSQAMLQKIYDNKCTWRELADFVKQNSSQPIDQSVVDKVPNSRILPITREDGSGTRDAFSTLTGVKEMPSANVVNSNGMMLQMVASGGFGYISYAFIPSITKDTGIRLSAVDGVRLANPVDSGDDWENAPIIDLNNPGSEDLPTNEEAIHDQIYKFQRPFIAIFNSFHKKINDITDFLIWIIEESRTSGLLEEIFKQEGLIRKVVLNPQNK